MFILPLRRHFNETSKKDNNKGGQLFGAILHIIHSQR